jgi:basic amino acid/polyamine antiporter, APA family
MAKSQKALGFWRTWSLSVGYMIGSGVFLMPTVLAPMGLLGLSSWVISGTGAILIALALANLARRITHVGGPYAYTREAFGGFAGFLIAWAYWISLWTATSAIVVAFVGYLGVFIPVLNHNFLLASFAGVASIAALVYINVVGIRQAGIFQLATTLVKMVPLIAIGVIGLFYVEPANIPEWNPSGGNPVGILATASILTMWAFVGLEAASVPSGDVVNPDKTIPRALVTATLVVVAIYFLSSFAVMGIMPGAELAQSQAPFAEAASLLWGPWGASAIAIGALVSTIGAANCSVLLSGQTPMAAAIDRLFPRSFGKLSKSGTPAFALIVSGVLSAILIALNYTKGFVAAFTFMILLSTLAVVIAYAFAAMADVLFAIKDKSWPNAKLVKNAAIGLGAFAFSMWLTVGSGQESVFYAFLLLMAGLPFYVFIAKGKN